MSDQTAVMKQESLEEFTCKMFEELHLQFF